MEAFIPQKINPRLILVGVIISLLYSPSLFNFFSHDDFFNLKISHINSISEFINFFNFFHGPEGFGFYRPLTTQVFFWVGWQSGLSSFFMHMISLIGLLTLTLLIYKLAAKFLSTSYALLVALLYGTSATHFGHTYYLSAFQEVGLGIFAFSAVLTFLNKRYWLSISFFIGALLSKESAVVIPVLVSLAAFYNKEKIQQIMMKLIPYGIITIVYLYIHTFYYGFAKGDSYIWDFSLRALNTIFWYFLWSLNVPEMVVDFIGPGFKINPHLLQFYGNFIIPFSVVFILFGMLTVISFFKNLKKVSSHGNLLLMGGLWFLISLLPVMFLPWHKFSYELTLPLFGVVLSLGVLLSLLNSRVITFTLLTSWVLCSIITNTLSYKTSWITQGGKASVNTLVYLQKQNLEGYEKVRFYDVAEDADLPWRPVNVLKNTLSDKNFFVVYYPGMLQVEFSQKIDPPAENKTLDIPARLLLKY